MLKTLLTGLFWLTATSIAASETLRISVLEIGTVNWELDTIRNNSLDTANGFRLRVKGVGGSTAAQVAFNGGKTDMIVSDWIWVARQRAAGRDYVFIPYSRAVGGLVVPSESPARDIADLKDMTIGIAGGPLDKSWLILRAHARQERGMNLKTETRQVFGAPPLIFKKATQRELDGAINFWHFMARLKAEGFREILSVADAAAALGLDPDIPMLGYVVRGELIRKKPELVKGFVRASQAAKRILATRKDAWEVLRPRMRAKSNSQFEALRAGFRAGIPASIEVDEKSAAALFELMHSLGGRQLTGRAAGLPDGVFYKLRTP